MRDFRRAVWSLAVLLSVCVVLAPAVRAEEAKFVCSRDVWVSDAGDERDCSMGKTPQLKIKSIQEMAILDFDLSGLKGKTVDGGWMYFKIVLLEGDFAVANFNLPFPRKHLLRRIGLSTVSTDWVEGQASASYQKDTAGFGATFAEASHTKKPWAWQGSDLTDVTMSNGNTLQAHGELEDQPDMWARVKVPAPLIESLIARDGFGWLMMDELGQGLANNFIYSRDSQGNEPYLVVNVTGSDAQAPAGPKVSVRAAPERAHLGEGAAVIDVAGADDVFCYFVKVNGRPVDQWRVARPKAGKSTVILDALKDSESVQVEVVACDAAGNRAEAVRAAGKASPALPEPPKVPDAWKPSPGEPPVRSGKMKVWAYPEICKIKPTNGALFEAEALKTDELAYQKANSVWDGASNTVRLFGARGEIVACQLALERTNRDQPLKDITIRLDGLTGPGKIAPERVKLFRLWYVRWPEYAIPIKAGEKLAIPAEDNAVRVQNVQSVYVDIAIPQDAKPGEYAGKIEISAAGVEPFSLPVKLQVYDFAIPDKMRFNPELNIYQSPGRVGSPTFFEAFRVAHYNRCTLSITQAGHDDGVKTPLPLEGQGAGVRVRDWTEYDRSFGPLLDGSAFKDLPRSGVPLPTCHIPMSHGTPLPVDRYYAYDGPKHGKGTTFIHALMCKPIEQAFSREYQQGFMSFARQIVQHAEQKGWTEPIFMFYMDGKPNYREEGRGTSYWTLDEPYNYDDWMALRFFGQLFRQGIEGAPKKTRWGYRCDISRPQWTRDWLNGAMTHMYVGGLLGRIRRCQIMAEEGPMVFYSYGACNRPEASNWGSAAWCLTTFLAGGDGVLPWQSLGTTTGQINSMRQEDPQGLVVIDPLPGHNAVGSLRIMALRRGAQDVEYLITLGETYGLNREQLKALVASKVSGQAQQQQTHADDAAPIQFPAPDPDAFNALREGIAKLIVEKK